MNKEVGAIIQARTSSVRLPKKVLKKIGNFEVIEWVIRRTKKSKLLKHECILSRSYMWNY